MTLDSAVRGALNFLLAARNRVAPDPKPYLTTGGRHFNLNLGEGSQVREFDPNTYNSSPRMPDRDSRLPELVPAGEERNAAKTLKEAHRQGDAPCGYRSTVYGGNSFGLRVPQAFLRATGKWSILRAAYAPVLRSTQLKLALTYVRGRWSVQQREP